MRRTTSWGAGLLVRHPCFSSYLYLGLAVLFVVVESVDQRFRPGDGFGGNITFEILVSANKECATRRDEAAHIGRRGYRTRDQMFDHQSWLITNLDLKSPLNMVVDHVAAKIANAWVHAWWENVPAKDEEEVGFLAIAYAYLSNRQTAVHKLERTETSIAARGDYRRPPSVNELYDGLHESSGVAQILGALVLAALAGGAVIAGALVGLSIVENVDAILRFFASGEALVLILPAAAPFLAAHILSHIFGKRFEYVFAETDRADWQLSQSNSSKKIDAERAQILAMMDPSSDGGQGQRTIADPDLPVAEERAVPIQPGITEYILSTGRVTIEDLGNDFRAIKHQHTIVFWASFCAFILCLLSGALTAIMYKPSIGAIGSIGALSGIVGTFSYKMLERARFSRISLTLFNSYVLEVHERMEEAVSIESIDQRRKARSTAWMNFRTGMNKLYALESRSVTRKSE
jgi:hypothetical protein